MSHTRELLEIINQNNNKNRNKEGGLTKEREICCTGITTNQKKDEKFWITLYCPITPYLKTPG